MLLDERIDLDSFEDWLVQNTWNIHLSRSAAAEDLTFAVEELLSEHSSGHLDERELRRELSRLLHRDTVTVVFANVPNVSYQVISVRAVPVSARL
jgi:hypothetical protein